MMWKKKDVINIIQHNNIKPGCSFYAYNLNICIKKINIIKEYFHDWNILYSVKSNPHPRIVETIINCGVGIDAASKNEVFLARKLGCPVENIFFSSPGKTNFDLESCYSCCNLIADSINEIKRIAMIAQDNNRIMKIGIRINLPNNDIIGKAFEIMSGECTQFGIAKEDISIIEDICKNNPIEIKGIHIYFGSQILDERTIIENFIKISDFVLEISTRFNVDYINFGGGFGIPYSDLDKELDLLFIQNDKILSEKIHILKDKHINLNLELGRYLVGQAGIFCASVEDIKTLYDKKYVILSSGINAFFRPAFTKELHKISSCKETSTTESVTITGNLCTPIDKYYENYIIEKLEIGDWLWFANAGAYGFSMSMQNFISHEKPLEIFV